MTEKQLISKIKELQQIRPRKDWVLFTKERILGSQSKEFELDREQTSIGLSEYLTGFRFVLGHKYAFSFIVILMFFAGTIAFAQNSLPGDTLYAIKRITEKSQAFFLSQQEQPKRSLELANKRLDDLTKIAQTNSVDNLAPAINEYKATVSEAAKKIAEKKPEQVKEIALEIKKLEENKQKVESLGVVIDDGTEELNNALSQLVEREINDLNEQVLTEEQEEVLEKMKEDYQSENYSSALEKILLLNNNPAE